MQDWHSRPVQLKFRLGERTLFTRTLRLEVCDVPLRPDPAAAVDAPQPPQRTLPPDCAGFLLRSLPVSAAQPRWRTCAGWLCYTPMQFERCYIDLHQSFAEYKAKFSSKSRSTIARKVRRFGEQFGGRIAWRRYASVDEMAQFHAMARVVSARTYQERLLDAGLPESPGFLREIQGLAARGLARGYILFDADKPVAYLFCPVREDALLYQYLGYDPAYMSWSPGTVLQWLALESLFAEQRFALFDFTEGQSEHKRFFATGRQRCANVYFLRRTAGNAALVLGHLGLASLSEGAGALLERVGLKARVRRLIRFGV